MGRMSHDGAAATATSARSAGDPGNASTGKAGGLLLAAAIVAVGFLGSRILGIVRTAVIARVFGSGVQLDAYNVAFNVPDLIFQVLAGATLGSAFIPVFARLYRRESDDRAWELASNVLNLVTVATAVLCLIAFIFAPVLVPLMAPGLVLKGKAIFLTRIMLLSPLLFSVSGMITGILNGRQHFLLPALAPIAYNLAIIFGAVVLAGPFGIEGLAIGVVAGAGLHLCVQLPGLLHERMKYHFTFDWRDSAVREVGRLMGPRVVGLAAGQFNFLVSDIFASKVGAGAIANLGFAWTIATLPMALFGMALSTAAFPRLAEHVADEDLAGLHVTVSRVLRAIMFLTIPAALGLAMLREPATVVLLQGGHFSAASSAVTAAALGFYCIGIVPQAGIEIHSRGFYAAGDTRTPVTLAVIAVVFNFLLSAAAWSRFGVNGLAFSVSLSSWLEWSMLYAFYIRRFNAAVAPDLWAIARITLCAGVMVLVLAIGFAPFYKIGRLASLEIAFAGTTAGLAVYAGMAHWLGISELNEAVSRVLGIIRRGNGSGTAEAASALAAQDPRA